MKKTILTKAAIAAFSLGACGAVFAQLSITPSLPDKAWTRKMWLPRFDAKKSLAANNTYDIVFLGDSITHAWETRGTNVWAKNFAQGEYKALNCGISGDRTEHVLWRLYNGQLANLSPKAFVLMIGTNNTGHRDEQNEPPTDTILGIQSILDHLKAKYPSAKIILHPIFPRGATVKDPCRVRNDLVNSEIKAFADGKRVLWCDFNSRLLAAEGVMETSMAKDLLHPGESGYVIWAEELKPFLDYALGKTKKAPKSTAPAASTALCKTGPEAARPKIKNYWLNNPNKKVQPRIRNKRAEQCSNTERYYDAIMIGDSITHGWEKSANINVFNSKFKGYKIFNAGFGGDKTQNALWNIRYGGILEGVHTRLITLMIGTNNTWNDTPENIAAGIKACVEAIREKQPQAKLLLMPLLPREVANKRGDRDFARKNGKGPIVMPKQKKVNELIRPLADGKNVIWFDLTEKFLDSEGLPDITLLPDGTHPGPEGYTVWADALLPYLKAL
jgi:beta-glucosidase